MYKEINSLSKEAVRARMLRNAVKLWGLKSTTAVDPFASLLIDAFSTEISKASGEIQAVHARILEKLARLLTPSIYTVPQPAHAIAFANATESRELLANHSEFFVTRQFPSTAKAVSDVQVDIHFTPVDDVALVNMQTAMMFSSLHCYHIDAQQNRIPLVRMPAQALPANKVILGIDYSGYTGEAFPEKISLYCANPAFEHLDFVYKLLPFVQVQQQGKSLRLSSGISYEGRQTDEGYEEIMREYAMRTRIEGHIKNAYRHQFFELHGLAAAAQPNELPENLAFIMEQKEVAMMLKDKKMVWLELTFPPQFTAEILDEFSFTLNAFPVYNRKWKSNEYALDIMGDNVPLSTDNGEHFLYVEDVMDSFGNKYREVPFSKTNDLQKGLYTVRTGGMERFNERNAIEMIANVLELTRDEVSAFGVLERDKVVEALKSMTAQMRLLEQKVVNAERATRQETNYVIVDPIGHIEHLRAAYWITNCDMANGIRRGTSLTQPKVTTVNLGTGITLLTDTHGGHKEQKGTDAIQAFKYALTTRDKIISVADIKSFCHMMLKGDADTVAVKRGTVISNKPKEGFIRTIEIEIVPRHYAHLGKEYWDNLATNLRNQIVLRGIDGIEYNVTCINRDDDSNSRH